VGGGVGVLSLSFGSGNTRLFKCPKREALT
jgi:hypothetical protein